MALSQIVRLPLRLFSATRYRRAGMTKRLLILGLVVAGVSLTAVNARATYGARISVDEPQYLLTAISLAEDLDLDISDELRDERYRPFHEVTLQQQTIDLDEAGTRISPHDPLLPALLALPYKLGGWVGARLAMATMAGVAAALTLFLAERHVRVRPTTAVLVVGGFFMSPPLISFGNQIYPAMPATIAVLVGVIAVLGGGADRARPSPQPLGNPTPHWWVGVSAIVALPWLAIKYVPLATVLAVALLWKLRTDRPLLTQALGVLAVSGLAYVLLHQHWYGGWTVYAAGDHFVGGEWEVVGTKINLVGRSRRLIGLLVDRGFGLAAWAPAYLGAPLGMAWLAKKRRSGWLLMIALVVVGWSMATWVALTMHGWWWPGRQLVPILPLAIVALAAAVDGSRAKIAALVSCNAAGLFGWTWLAVEASTGRRTLIFDFRETSNPFYRMWSTVLPDHQSFRLESNGLTLIWTAIVVLATAVVWLRTPRPGNRQVGS